MKASKNHRESLAATKALATLLALRVHRGGKKTKTTIDQCVHAVECLSDYFELEYLGRGSPTVSDDDFVEMHALLAEACAALGYWEHPPDILDDAEIEKFRAFLRKSRQKQA